METKIILFIVLGILALVLLLQRGYMKKKSRFDSYNHHYPYGTEDWSILTSFSKNVIFSKYAGELRFGPAYIHLKSKPKNVFGKDFFGDWFYRTENGVYFQKWNSNPIIKRVHTRANNDLIYYDKSKKRIEIIETGIKSFHWKIEKDENNMLTLISDNGKLIRRIPVIH